MRNSSYKSHCTKGREFAVLYFSYIAYWWWHWSGFSLTGNSATHLTCAYFIIVVRYMSCACNGTCTVCIKPSLTSPPGQWDKFISYQAPVQTGCQQSSFTPGKEEMTTCPRPIIHNAIRFTVDFYMFTLLWKSMSSHSHINWWATFHEHI